METTHRVHVADSADMAELADGSVELVVTSPPYPMVELWDGTFADLDPAIGDRLAAGDGPGAFDRMHDALGRTWSEVARVLVDGGIACVNVGDATRTLDGSFRVYQNHAQIVDRFDDLGFEPLPEILWRKPTNSAAKFMGSGMLPPNAYATLEHEYVLVFRKGATPRRFPPGDDRRYAAAYFWEERNEWFSDVWTGVTGTRQASEAGRDRTRSGAYPFEIPYRLINMYSVYGDTVLDPFWGTGTTTEAAMVAARDSVGYELDGGFLEGFEARLGGVADRADRVLEGRLDRHRRFVERRRADGDPPGYVADRLGLPVVTKQERGIEFRTVDAVEGGNGRFVATHRLYRPAEAEDVR